ncbi:CHASE domain-containing protein [Microvirga subterranea]|uniref:histidine kinase n=1 Tax=Microvirga subterranea TaxID=186651 RepID=A0A370HKI6_9HYPH|nr:CHASE domain-containing protein [Microvirga subterranea]RDI58655.1 CHASE1-domain containing sensor protein [Microvirga subterranea]
MLDAPAHHESGVRRSAKVRRSALLWPAVVLFVGLLTVGVVVGLLRQAVQEAEQARFEALVRGVEARISRQVDAHLSLIYSVAGFVATMPQPVTRASYASFIRQLDVADRFQGVQGIGFARRLEGPTLDEAERTYRAIHGPEFKVWPRVGQPEAFPIVLLEPMDHRNQVALGYDMYTEPTRREAMARARNSLVPALSGIVELVQEIDADKQPGFLIYLPVYAEGASLDDLEARREALMGFAYAPFRARNFFEAAVRDLAPRVSIRVYDGTVAPERLLFSSARSGNPEDADAAFTAVRPLEVAGRTWIVEHRTAPGYSSQSSGGFLLVPVAGLGVMLVLALSFLTYQQALARTAAERQARAMRQADREKTLLLQEMKHRIKNAIARVQAVARQTVREAEDLQDFTARFEARLASMSATHDLLTRTRWEGAELEDLLRSELSAVQHEGSSSLHGPSVFLTGREVMALALTVHELATNCVKYGSLSHPGGRLDVRWSVEPHGSQDCIAIEWRETGRSPILPGERIGFGSRLIEATIVRELNGSFHRDFCHGGVICRIRFPREAEAPAKAL